MKYFFEPTKGYSEEYVVTYWIQDNPPYFSQQRQSVYFASKGRHLIAAKAVQKKLQIKEQYIISVIYQ